MSQTLEQSKSSSGRENTETTTLFAPGATVRVSDLVGGLKVAADSQDGIQQGNDTVSPSMPAIPARSTSSKFVSFAGLKLDWYDCGVALLIVASLAAGIVCLLSGQ